MDEIPHTSTELFVEVRPEHLKPYAGPDVNQKFPGEDDLLWCDRCKVHHRRGAGWAVEQERMIQKAARALADRIDGELLDG